MKSRFDIEEYSFGQTTLEQVFLEFAKLQEAANQDKGGEQASQHLSSYPNMEFSWNYKFTIENSQ